MCLVSKAAVYNIAHMPNWKDAVYVCICLCVWLWCVWGYWNLCLLHSLRLTILEKDCLVKNTIFVPKLERQWHLTVSFVETMILAGLLKVLDQDWKLQDTFQGLIASFHGLMTECVYVNSWVCRSVSLLIHVANVLSLPTWKKCPNP